MKTKTWAVLGRWPRPSRLRVGSWVLRAWKSTAPLGSFWRDLQPNGRLLQPTGGTNWGPKSHCWAKHATFSIQNCTWNNAWKKRGKLAAFLQKDWRFDMAKCLKNTVNAVFFWYTVFSHIFEQLCKHDPKKYTFLTINLTIGRLKVDC